MLHFNKLKNEIYVYKLLLVVHGVFFPGAVKAAATVEPRP